MPPPTRIELSRSLQPLFLPIKEGLAYQMARFYVNELSMTTSFGISVVGRLIFCGKLAIEAKFFLDISVAFEYST